MTKKQKEALKRIISISYKNLGDRLADDAYQKALIDTRMLEEYLILITKEE